MKGPLLFLIVMTMLVLGAIRERRWAERQEKLRKAREALAAFHVAWPVYAAFARRYAVAMKEFGTAANLAAWQMRRSARLLSDREDALLFAFRYGRKIGPTTYSNPDDEGLQS